MNIADWHLRYYEPERRSDLIRQAAKRSEHASESIADYAPEEQDDPPRPELRLVTEGQDQ